MSQTATPASPTEYTTTTPCTSKLGTGHLTLTITIEDSPALKDEFLSCRKELNGSLFLRLDGSLDILPFGHINAWIIDKTLTTARPKKGSDVASKVGVEARAIVGADAKPTPTLAWKKDFLDDCPEYSPAGVKSLFDPAGHPKHSQTFSARVLGGQEFCYLSSIKLDHKYRSAGLGSAALRLFLSCLTRLPAPHTYSGSVHLIPVDMDYEPPNGTWITGCSARDAAVEMYATRRFERLLAFYRKNGFAMWVDEIPDGEPKFNGLKIMGLESLSVML
ncbi:hypothetical protein LTR86_004974 [Recurvomyces mirabilis]|nr:hypothetical protein LTR86_004974 [Recurvomyces mirabilis]